MTQREDYYQVLGVAQEADTLEIRRAYRRLARQHHPDHNPDASSPERFRAITEAYEVLGDPVSRTRHDRGARPVARRDNRRATPAPRVRPWVLELFADEARIAATRPLTLIAADGAAIVLPAGIGDGDQISLRVSGRPAVLTICVRET